MKLPSMVQGWLNPTQSPEKLLTHYFSTGNKRYLKLLVEQFNGALYHYLLTQSNKETAEDVVQTTWLKVMKSSSSSIHTSVKSWLFTIARHALIDELRRQNKWRMIELEEQHIRSHTMEAAYETKHRLAQFNDAIEHLPFHQREVFVFQQEGFSVQEISVLTEASFETVKSRLRYARKQLKHTLEHLS